MNMAIVKYITTGVFNNVLYYPNNEHSINQYVRSLAPLVPLIKKESPEEIFSYLKNKSGQNIFVVSFVLAAVDTYSDEMAEYVMEIMENKFDFYIFTSFIKRIKNSHKDKYFNRIVSEIPYIMEDKKEFLSTGFKFTFANSSMLKKRDKVIKELKQHLSNGSFNDADIDAIQEHHIHFNELGYELSYTIDISMKQKAFNYFIQNFKIGDVIYCVDKTFRGDISPSLLFSLSNTLKNQGRFEDYMYLLMYLDQFNNNSLRLMLSDILLNYDYTRLANNISPCRFDAIRIIPNNRWEVTINNEDKIKYLHCIAVFSCVLSEIWKKDIYLAGNKLTGDMALKIQKIDEYKTINTSDILAFPDDCVFSSGLNLSNTNWDVYDNGCADYARMPEDVLNIKGINIKTLTSMLFYGI